LDTKYIDCWDVFIDFKIMLQTVLQIFRRDSGAY